MLLLQYMIKFDDGAWHCLQMIAMAAKYQ